MNEKIFETPDTILQRHSVRHFTEQPISQSALRTLRDELQEINSKDDVHIELVTDEPNAFGKSLLAHYGKFSGVRNYFCLMGTATQANDERLGYEGEKLVLLSQALGLNTCWVGMSFSNRSVPCSKNEGEKIRALIAFGYGENKGKAHPSRQPEKVCRDYQSAPQWMKRGVEFALLAPTAMNQQKFRFRLSSPTTVTATTLPGFFNHIDLGIARLHFEIGAGRDNFNWDY